MTKYANIVDIHSHVLPSIDDGPYEWSESLEMIYVARDNNIRKIITTPHWIYGTSWQPTSARVENDVKRLNELLAAENIDVEVFPGMEIAINDKIPQLARGGDILTLANSRYLLLEVPFVSLPIGIESIIFTLVSYGFIPILAHPERNKDIQSAPGKVLDLIERGALVQITAGSLCGNWGNGAMQCSRKLVKAEAVFALATDAHSVDRRPPNILEAVIVLESMVGEKRTREILSNAEMIIHG